MVDQTHPALRNWRASFPEYNDLSDQEVFDRFYTRFFSDQMSREEYNSRLNSIEVPNYAGGGTQMSPFDVLVQEAEARIQREAYEAERAARPTREKVGDWTRDALTGLTWGAWPDIAGFIGGDDWENFEREAQAAHAAESPIGSAAMQMAGAAPWLGAPYVGPALRGPGAGAPVTTRAAANAAAAGGGTMAYDFLSTPGSFDERADAATENIPLAMGLGGILPLGLDAAAPVFRAAGLPQSVTPSGAANRIFQDTLRDSAPPGVAMTPADLAAQMTDNPLMMPLDIDPNLRQLAQGIATQPGRGRATLNTAVANRAAQMSDEITRYFDEGLGAAPDVRASLGAINNASRLVGQQFEQLWPSIGPVDITDFVNRWQTTLPQIGQQMTRSEMEVARVLRQLTGTEGLEYSASRLHQIQSSLRETADALAASSSGEDRNLARTLRGMRQGLIDAIDGASGGQYRPIMSQYADTRAVQDAFDRGWEILANPQTGEAGYAARPEYWQEWVNTLSEQELAAARLGARARVDSYVNSARGDVNRAIAIPQTEFNRDRLAILFGDQVADRLTQQLAEAQQMMRAETDLFRGSQTGPRLVAAQGPVNVPNSMWTPLQAGGLPAAATFGAFATGNADLGIMGAGGTMAAGLAGAAAREAAKRRNDYLAQLLSSSGPQGAQRIADIPTNFNYTLPQFFMEGAPRMAIPPLLGDY